MSEYIKKEDVLEIVKRTSGDYAAAFSEIRKLPKADVAPGVHGKWEVYVTQAFRGFDDFGDPIYKDAFVYRCPECGRKTVIEENYCPNCGIKMDLE